MKMEGDKSMSLKAEGIRKGVRCRPASPVRTVRLHCQTWVPPMKPTSTAAPLKRWRQNTFVISVQRQGSLWRGTSKELVKERKGT